MCTVWNLKSVPLLSAKVWISTQPLTKQIVIVQKKIELFVIYIKLNCIMGSDIFSFFGAESRNNEFIYFAYCFAMCLFFAFFFIVSFWMINEICKSFFSFNNSVW